MHIDLWRDASLGEVALRDARKRDLCTVRVLLCIHEVERPLVCHVVAAQELQHGVVGKVARHLEPLYQDRLFHVVYANKLRPAVRGKT